MLTVEEIERTIEMLEPDEFAQLAAWFAEFQAAMAESHNTSTPGATLDDGDKTLESQDKLGNFEVQ